MYWFPNILDATNSKICKKFISNEPFLRAESDREVKSCRMLSKESVTVLTQFSVSQFLSNCMYFRVTLLEQLSVAEFSGELARPKVYENGHKNDIGILFDLVSKVKNSTF